MSICLWQIHIAYMYIHVHVVKEVMILGGLDNVMVCVKEHILDLQISRNQAACRIVIVAENIAKNIQESSKSKKSIKTKTCTCNYTRLLGSNMKTSVYREKNIPIFAL